MIILKNNFLCWRSNFKNSCFGFHQVFKHSKTIKPRGHIQVFLAFGNLMKPSHSFLKYYIIFWFCQWLWRCQSHKCNNQFNSLVLRNHGKLNDDIYSKPTHTEYRYLDVNSHYDRKHKISTAATLSRALNLPNSEPGKACETAWINTALQSNGYSKQSHQWYLKKETVTTAYTNNGGISCYRSKHIPVHFYLSTHPMSHPKNWFLPWVGLKPISPWLLVGHAKPLHHQGHHSSNAAD